MKRILVQQVVVTARRVHILQSAAASSSAAAVFSFSSSSPSSAGWSACSATTAVPQPVNRFLSSTTFRHFSSSSSSNNDSSHHRQPTSRIIGLDYYALLEVHRHFLRDNDLKQSYYRLAKQYHPDRLLHLSQPERERAAKQFAQIGVAYSVLSDPDKKRHYDLFMDMSAIGDQDRMLHWVKINRPPDQIGYEGFMPEYEKKKQEQKDESAKTDSSSASSPSTPATPSKPKVVLPVFRSS